MNYLTWARQLEPVAHPEPSYHYYSEIHAQILPFVEAQRVTPFLLGTTVEKRPIWGFRVHDPLHVARALRP